MKNRIMKKFALICTTTALSACGINKASPKSSTQASIKSSEIKIGSASLTGMGVGYTNSCGYYSNSNAIVEITVQDQSIGWGANLTLLTGLSLADREGASINRLWESKQEIKMESSGPFIWHATREFKLGERGSAVSYDSLSFIIKVENADGSIRYIKPSEGDSYWNASFEAGQLSCRNAGDRAPKLNPVDLKIVK